MGVDAKHVSEVCIDVETITDKYICPKCGELTSSVNHRYPHRVRDNSISGRKAYLVIHKKVFQCRSCDYEFAEKLQAVHSRRIYTKRYERTIFERCLENTISNVSKSENLPYDCVRGIYTRIADICIDHLLSYNEDIEILGIDEISIRKGHKNYQAVISNIGGAYVMDVLPDSHLSSWPTLTNLLHSCYLHFSPGSIDNLCISHAILSVDLFELLCGNW